MTDNEIIDIAGNQPFCELAVAVDSKGDFIRVKHLIDIIKRKDTEIERLNVSIKEVNEYLSEGDFAKGISLIISLVKELTE